MSRKITVSVLLAILMCLIVSVTYAQDGPRPTPTDIGPAQPTPETTPEPTAEPTSEPGTSNKNQLGNVRGFVYVDVNGDGNCVNTGIAGEDPIASIPLEFMSSDENYVFTHTTGENGDYELAGAGQSNWRVTAKPDSDWIVTSENPLYALVDADNLSATDVNFCVSKGGTTVYPMLQRLTVSADSDYVLPEAGAPATATTTLWPLLLGLNLIALGLGWRGYEIYRK